MIENVKKGSIKRKKKQNKTKQAQLRAAADRLGHSNRGSVMIVIKK